MAFFRRKGFTLTEVMIVVAIIAILILASIWVYQKQLAKGRDARRKADLDRLQNILEDYYNDNERYPEDLPCGSGLAPYISQIPCDPLNNSDYNYLYQTDGGWYRIYANLENEDDLVIAEVGCGAGCGPGCAYNYGVSSPNVGLGECVLVGECSQHYWACQSGYCNDFGAAPPICPLGGPYFCGLPCGIGCRKEVAPGEPFETDCRL